MNDREVLASRQAGATLPEAVLSLAIMAMVAAGFGQALSNSRGDLKLTGAASELATLRAAGDRYVQDNFQTLVASAAGGPVSVSIATLASLNYLPPSFPTSNAYGQAYQLYIRERSPTVLESIALTTGGAALSASQGGKIALLLKGSGGFTPAGSATINGTNGAWSAPLGTYVPASAPKPSGNPAAYSIQYAVMGPTGALIRYATGNPADNQMTTALAMNGNNITGANNIGANSVSLPSGGVYSMGASYLYGDNSNTAIRQNGGFYIQDTAGNTRAVIDGSGNVSGNGLYANYVHSNGTVDANQVSANYIHSNGSMAAAGDLNSNRLLTNYIGLPAGASLNIGGSAYYGDGYSNASRANGYFVVQDAAGNNRWYVDPSANTWQAGTMQAPNVQLLGGGLWFRDGTVQFTAAQPGLGVVRNAGGNNFYCDNGFTLVWLHYDCGCTNNATWPQCQPA